MNYINISRSEQEIASSGRVFASKIHYITLKQKLGIPGNKNNKNTADSETGPNMDHTTHKANRSEGN
jgi:hypothetical protein